MDAISRSKETKKKFIDNIERDNEVKIEIKKSL